MIPNKDSDDSNVIVVSDSGAFDALNKTSDLFLPIRSGLCDEEVEKQLQEHQLALQKELSRQKMEKVILIENISFVSQHASQEKMDARRAWLVRNRSRIIVLVLALAL